MPQVLVTIKYKLKLTITCTNGKVTYFLEDMQEKFLTASKTHEAKDAKILL